MQFSDSTFVRIVQKLIAVHEHRKAHSVDDGERCKVCDSPDDGKPKRGEDHDMLMAILFLPLLYLIAYGVGVLALNISVGFDKPITVLTVGLWAAGLFTLIRFTVIPVFLLPKSLRRFTDRERCSCSPITKYTWTLTAIAGVTIVMAMAYNFEFVASTLLREIFPDYTGGFLQAPITTLLQ